MVGLYCAGLEWGGMEAWKQHGVGKLKLDCTDKERYLSYILWLG